MQPTGDNSVVSGSGHPEGMSHDERDTGQPLARSDVTPPTAQITRFRDEQGRFHVLSTAEALLGRIGVRFGSAGALRAAMEVPRRRPSDVPSTEVRTRLFCMLHGRRRWAPVGVVSTTHLVTDLSDDPLTTTSLDVAYACLKCGNRRGYRKVQMRLLRDRLKRDGTWPKELNVNEVSAGS